MNGKHNPGNEFEPIITNWIRVCDIPLSLLNATKEDNEKSLAFWLETSKRINADGE